MVALPDQWQHRNRNLTHIIYTRAAILKKHRLLDAVLRLLIVFLARLVEFFGLQGGFRCFICSALLDFCVFFC